MALAMLGTAAGTVHAQNVQLYGIVDTGYIRESGSDARMGSNTESRIGFKGTEDLGSGLKATFELEKRLNLNDGTNSGNRWDSPQGDGRHNAYDNANGINADWKGAANVGLSHNDWGAIRLGRVNNLGVETYRRIDPFDHNGIGAALTAIGNWFYTEQLSNTVRYDSPKWSGVSFGLSYTTANDDHQGNSNAYNVPYSKVGNDGFNIALQYDNGPLLLLGNYYRMADSNDSDVWSLGAAYRFGTVRLSIGYQDSDYQYEPTQHNAEQKEAIFGVQWDIGPGQLNFSYNYARLEQGSYDEKAQKYSLGYTYNLSKRTAVYGVVSYLDADDDIVGHTYNSNHTYRDAVTGVQLGMTHKF